jgi:hypothetical protein
MPGKIDFRRGGSAARLALVPNDGELLVDQDLDRLFVGDGSLLGGHQVDGTPVITTAGTSYTVLYTDAGKIVVFNNASPVAVALAAANSSSGIFMPPDSKLWVINIGVGAATITAAGPSTINGAATLILQQNQGATIHSDGVNYFAIRGAAGSTATTVPVVAKTANFSVSAGESGTRYTNVGAGGTVIGSLPAAVIGLNYGLSVIVNQILRFAANGTDVITWSGSDSAPGGTIEGNTKGWFIMLECHAAGTWVVTQSQGGWTLT